MYCKNCGNEISSDLKFCPHCGYELKKDTPNKPLGFRSNKTWKKALAILYLMFLGVMFLGIFITTDEMDYTKYDAFITKIDLVFIFLLFALPYCWFSNIFSIKTKFGKISKGKFVQNFLIPFCIVIVMFSCIGLLDSTKSDEYKVAMDAISQKQSEENNNEVEKVTKSNSKTNPESKTTKPATDTEKSTTKTEKTTAQTNNIENQLMAQGFTLSEAKIIRKHFETIGITSISNIRPGLGTGIDDLQAFRCTIYDYSTITMNFTVENRILCFAEIAGLPATKTDYYYINMFGNLKAKTSQTTKSVTMYDIWDENGEIIENAAGYKAVFDYANKKITEYK